jgi:phospholipid-translocating ATPase
MTINDRDSKIKNVMALLESDMELLGITGVEDKLQENVYQTLENLRNAGIQIWMLTGDKMGKLLYFFSSQFFSFNIKRKIKN